MFKSRAHVFTAAALLLLAIPASGLQVQASPTIKSKASTASIAGPSTCPSRSINYITQTLPQQCLTSSWASTSKAQKTDTNETSSTSHLSVEAPSDTQDSTIAVPEAPRSTQPKASDPSISSPSATTTTSHEQGTASLSPASEIKKQSETTIRVEQEAENDSPLDTANFLSFEEWKRQNLAKAGQSAEHLAARAGTGVDQRRRPGLNNALDSLGEDTEIEIDFGGFVDPGNPPPIHSLSNHGSGQLSQDERSEDNSAEELSPPRKKGKDAGRTCKERFNYASFDCASTVLKTNSECKGSTAVLVENKDSYMLNICSAKNKFFIVELCDDILIDTVVLANFEFFSSMFRTFRVSVSDRYPVKLDKWRGLGTFEARNSREVQAFLVENPLIWARYVRVEFLTHFGNEYYCPVSLLRVHGTTMMEEFNHDVKGSRNDDDLDSEASDVEEPDFLDSAPADIVSADALKEKAQETSQGADATSTGTSSATTDSSIDRPSSTSMHIPDAVSSSSSKPLSSPGFTSYNFSAAMQTAIFSAPSIDDKYVCSPEDRPVDAVSPSAASNIGQIEKFPEESLVVTAIQTPSHSSFSNEDTTKTPESSKTVLPVVPDKSAVQNKSEQVRSSGQTSVSTVRAQSSSTQPANPNPTTQESFFKSVHKRLQLLESNSTLSLQYIEEQSRILRDAFSKVEKRQLGKTTTFLETLNTTVLTELRDFRHQYDQIWQSTVLELSSQREQSQHEVVALSARLSLLADEIVFQKRMAIIQFGLILLCLGLIIFSRHSSQATYFELPPVVQNAINKSSANLSRHAPSFDSLGNSPSPTRPSSRYGLFRGLTHRSIPSEESQLDDRRKSTGVEYSPPSPTSLPSSSGDHRNDAVSDADEHSSDFSPEPEQGAVRQTKSSPSTPSGQRDEQRELGDRTLLPSEAVEETQAQL